MNFCNNFHELLITSKNSNSVSIKKWNLSAAPYSVARHWDATPRSHALPRELQGPVGSRRQDLIVWDLSESKGRNIRNLLQIHRDSYKTHMGVSINGSTPKWMAYSMENPKLKWMIWRYLHILVVKIESRFNNPKLLQEAAGLQVPLTVIFMNSNVSLFVTWRWLTGGWTLV